MTDLIFERDGWLDGVAEDPDTATLTRLRIIVGNALLTRAFSRRNGGETDALNVPLFPLASHLAKNWWTLLFEPQRPNSDTAFLARHRLDMPMHGYVFPALAICSAGDEAMLVDWTIEDNDHSPLQFLTGAPKEPARVSRVQAEPVLMDLVASAFARLTAGSRAYLDLREDWDRVETSMSSLAELGYCMAAGRLGVDPYDEDAPDIAALAGNLPPDLFDDISDAIALSKLPPAAKWTSEVREQLRKCPQIDVAGFGAPTKDDLRLPAWAIGASAARTLRAHLGLKQNKPAKGVEELLGGAVRKTDALAPDGPSEIRSLIYRSNGAAHVGTISRSSRQQRFRACAAAYVAWCTPPGDERAATVALTRSQQASRAFAAEMVAPQEFLRERAQNRGFTGEELEEVAGHLIAPFDTVLWQAQRAGINLWDVEVPSPQPPGIFAKAENAAK